MTTNEPTETTENAAPDAAAPMEPAMPAGPVAAAPAKGKGGNAVWIVVVVLFLLLGIGAGGAVWYVNKQRSEALLAELEIQREKARQEELARAERQRREMEEMQARAEEAERERIAAENERRAEQKRREEAELKAREAEEKAERERQRLAAEERERERQEEEYKESVKYLDEKQLASVNAAFTAPGSAYEPSGDNSSHDASSYDASSYDASSYDDSSYGDSSYGDSSYTPPSNQHPELDSFISGLQSMYVADDAIALYRKRLLTLLPLIREGSDVNITLVETKGNTALHYACGIGDYSLVQWLLSHGANPNAVTNKGATPLMCAGGSNANSIRSLLRQYGATR